MGDAAGAAVWRLVTATRERNTARADALNGATHRANIRVIQE
jgi:hypothetical protein